MNRSVLESYSSKVYPRMSNTDISVEIVCFKQTYDSDQADFFDDFLRFLEL